MVNTNVEVPFLANEVAQLFQAESTEKHPWCNTVKKVALFIIKWTVFLPFALVAFGVNRWIFPIGTGSLAETKGTNDNARTELMRVEGAKQFHFLTVDGVNLEGMFLPKDGASKTVLIFSGSHQSHEHYTPQIAIPLHEKGYNVMLFNYRGFGESEGKAYSEEAFALDGEAAYQYLSNRKGVDSKDIVLWGYSMGGAIATDLATKHPESALVLDRTFANMKKKASMHMSEGSGVIAGYCAYFFTWLAGANFEVKNKLPSLQNKVMIVRETVNNTMLSDSDFASMNKSLFERPSNPGNEQLEVQVAHEGQWLPNTKFPTNDNSLIQSWDRLRGFLS